EVGVGLEQASRDRIGHALRHLRTRGVVEIDARYAGVLKLQRRKRFPHGLDRKDVCHCDVTGAVLSWSKTIVIFALRIGPAAWRSSRCPSMTAPFKSEFDERVSTISNLSPLLLVFVEIGC